MLENPPILTIHRGFTRPAKALIDAFRGAQTSHLADAMDGRGSLDYRIKPLDPSNAVFAGRSPIRRTWRPCSARCRRRSPGM